jgi:hypothetical protein
VQGTVLMQEGTDESELGSVQDSKLQLKQYEQPGAHSFTAVEEEQSIALAIATLSLCTTRCRAQYVRSSAVAYRLLQTR